MKHLAAGFAVAAALASWPAAAQTPDNALRDIKKINLIIEDLSGGAAACGVSRDALRNVLVGRTVAAPFTTAEDGKDKVPTLYVKATTMQLQLEGNPCVTSLAIKLYEFQRITIAATKRQTTGSVVLWERGTMFATARDTHGQAVAEALAGKFQEFVNAWNADNNTVSPPSQQTAVPDALPPAQMKMPPAQAPLVPPAGATPAR